MEPQKEAKETTAYLGKRDLLRAGFFLGLGGYGAYLVGQFVQGFMAAVLGL